MDKKENNYILGLGMAGLIAGYYNPDYKIIGEQPLGQLNSEFTLGPRILQYSPELEELLFEIFGSMINRTTVKIGFQDENGIHDSPPEGFREEYCYRTRGHRNVEPSFLSGGQTEIEILTIDNDINNSFEILAQTLFDIAEKRGQVITSKVKKITTDQIFTNTLHTYNKLISTIPLSVFNNLYSDHFFSPDVFGLKNKNYIITEYEKYQEQPPYLYVYSLIGPTRITYTKNYIVNEVMDIDYNNSLYKNALKKISIKQQMVNSLGFTKFKNIEFVGRLGQWNHSILTGDIVKRMKG